ncbi:MAG: GTPase Era [Pseudomonadota bacterium]|nr:MAG: GTPase Era [Pseudomonadota bacterium]
MSDPRQTYRCGYVALIGRPNVGKSTLLNYLLGQKISITSDKPQTTRHRILGVKTSAQWQIVYVDTPGLHGKANRAMNQYMNRAATSILNDVNVIVLVIEALKWKEDDELALQRLANVTAPVVLAVNKVDRVADKARLLPFLQEVSAKREFLEVIPVSATRGTNLEQFESTLGALLPEGEPYFPEDQVTDRSERFLAAEIIREKLMRRLGQELPYRLTVQIERYEPQEKLVRIYAVIWVDRPNQKAIVIGKDGQLLKEVGREARVDIQRQQGRKVYLNLWVKVKEGWFDDERALQSLGYGDEP